MRKPSAVICSAFVMLAGCGSDDSGPLFPEKPECQGDAVTAYAGTQPQVISTL
ncbi:MAG: hypothetical protein WKG01_21050 [Kofleriaceae bacterium]